MLAAEQTPRVSEKPTLLFVDDERRVLTSMRALFRRIYNVKTASSASEALDLLEHEHVDVLISDQRMPEVTGVELLAQVRTQYPHTMRILLTGYSDLEAIEASINEGEVFRYLVKPCPPEDLKRVVELAVTAARADLDVSVPTVTDRVEPTPLRLADERDLAAVELKVAAESQEILLPPEPAVARSVENAPVATELEEASEQSAITGADPAHSELAAETADPAVDHALADLADRPVDVVVLSRDEKLRGIVVEAMADEATVHCVHFLDEAMELMTTDPIGVLVTDLAVNEHEVNLMTRELKQYVPELVTILASERSDASLLIDLINHGQVFRFLLKPVHQVQCRIWLRSAIAKHKELLASPEALLRHVVDEAEHEVDEIPAASNQLWSDDAPTTMEEMRSRIRNRAMDIAVRMGDSISKESQRALGIIKRSRAAQSVSEKYADIKRRISQWKASHG